MSHDVQINESKATMKLIEGYLGTKEAAMQLGICVTELCRLCREQRLRHRRHGKRYLFEQQDLIAYMNSLVIEPIEPVKAKCKIDVQLKHLKG